MRGGYREGAGRKAPAGARNIRKLYRFSKAEYEMIKRAIKIKQMVEAEFVREVVIREAKKIINEQ